MEFNSNIQQTFNNLKDTRDSFIEALESYLKKKFKKEYVVIQSSVEYKITNTDKETVKEYIKSKKDLDQKTSDILLNITEINGNTYVRVTYK